MIKIYVTTCPKYEHLIENFSKLMKKFWDREFIVHKAKQGEQWSNQILRLLNEIEDDVFILLQEDFYLLKPPTDLKFLNLLEKYAQEHTNIGRISLQSIDDGYSEYQFFDKLGKRKSLYKLAPNSIYLCSFEASIFRKDFLLKYLRPNEDSREAEVKSSKRCLCQNEIVLVPKKKILHYTDAIRGGESRIRVKKGFVEIIQQDEGGKDIWFKTKIKI